MKGKTTTLIALTLFALFAAAPLHAGERIICASTTSTQNSGLFGHIVPLFEERTGIRVHVLAVGTGAAIEIGKRGDADLVMVHARDLELRAMEEGYFVDRSEIMYNDFVIIGPPEDPAGVRGSKSVIDAIKSIDRASGPFVSRGDNSGTHRKELALWEAAGIDPTGERWYMEVGQGMAKAQRVSNEKRAYALTDRGTWLSRKDALDLAVLYEGDRVLFNQYGVMAVNPSLHPHVKYQEAMEFIRWLVSGDGQGAIGSFRDSGGNRLFTPNAKGEGRG
jgi:tungstate transport system substrate-binding protein